MRPVAPVALLSLLALALAGCTTPFTPYPTSPLPEVRANFVVRAYDSDDNNLTDGIAVTLLNAQPTLPLVGSDVVFNRNGNTNVTVWRCPQREATLCSPWGPGGVGSGGGLLSWNQGETVYLRGIPGVDRLNIAVKERFVYNTTVRIDEDRDTEVWAALAARGYDSNGNGTLDGIEIDLIDSDKQPFSPAEVQVLDNQVPQVVYSDAQRLQEFNGQLARGGRVFIKGYVGDNHVVLFLRATRYDLGVYVLGE